jgi:hypothetical protein
MALGKEIAGFPFQCVQVPDRPGLHQDRVNERHVQDAAHRRRQGQRDRVVEVRAADIRASTAHDADDLQGNSADEDRLPDRIGDAKEVSRYRALTTATRRFALSVASKIVRPGR